MPLWRAPTDEAKTVSIPLTEEQVKGLLKRYDRDGDGKINKKELGAAFKQMGLRFCDWKARRAVRKADANGDGVISADELDDLVKYARSRWGFTIS